LHKHLVIHFYHLLNNYWYKNLITLTYHHVTFQVEGIFDNGNTDICFDSSHPQCRFDCNDHTQALTELYDEKSPVYKKPATILL